MSEKIKPVYERVKLLLESHSHYRDNDNMLVSKIWWQEIFGGAKVKRENCTMSLYDFLTNYTNGEVTSADSITRARRKLQEEFPHLRGKTYNQRQNVETEKTKTEIKELGSNLLAVVSVK
jgi:hypothetical protein